MCELLYFDSHYIEPLERHGEEWGRGGVGEVRPW